MGWASRANYKGNQARAGYLKPKPRVVSYAARHDAAVLKRPLLASILALVMRKTPAKKPQPEAQ